MLAGILAINAAGVTINVLDDNKTPAPKTSTREPGKEPAKTRVIPLPQLGPATKDGTQGVGEGTPGIAGGRGAGFGKDGTKGVGEGTPGIAGGRGAGGELDETPPNVVYEQGPPAPGQGTREEAMEDYGATPEQATQYPSEQDNAQQPNPFEVPRLDELGPKPEK
ncbi:MAG TPA: hypothetical protein VFK11_00920 [Candidatus Saccharimonadales bacterium]|nr:hypothetical protein [Candidatus Saccharimonadales bacterium]